MLDGFPLFMRFTVPFSDCDMLQHVNNVAYIRWCETVRTEYFARVMRSDINSDHGMIQANIDFTYEHQIGYREEIAIGVRVSRLGNKSLDYAYEIWSISKGRRAARGTTTVVAFDFVNQRTIQIPQAWRDAVAAFEAGPQQSFI
jgi:acyl-CoA thioester hydrolase